MKVRNMRSEPCEQVADVKKTQRRPLRLFVKRGPERRDNPYKHMTDSEIALLGLDVERRTYHRREIDVEAVKNLYKKQSKLLYWVMVLVTAVFLNGLYWVFFF